MTDSMNGQSRLLARALMILAAVALIAGHGTILVYARSHTTISAAVAAGVMILVAIKHIGLFAPYSLCCDLALGATRDEWAVVSCLAAFSGAGAYREACRLFPVREELAAAGRRTAINPLSLRRPTARILLFPGSPRQSRPRAPGVGCKLGLPCCAGIVGYGTEPFAGSVDVVPASLEAGSDR
jgi:hypothetical protein